MMMIMTRKGKNEASGKTALGITVPIGPLLILDVKFKIETSPFYT
jgi:hypothetical protein